MLKKNKEYIGFSLSENIFKLAHIRISDGVTEVLHLHREETNGASGEELVQKIHAAIKGLNAKGASAVCVINLSMTTTKNIEIPSLDEQEIKSIIDLQAGRHTPYAREEILMGYINFGIYQRNYSKVLLVIVSRESVKKQLEILEMAGGRVARVLFPPEGMARFYARALNLKSAEHPLGIIHIGGQVTDFTVEFHGTVIACRGFPIGMQHLLGIQGQEARDRFISELKKSIESYQSEDIDQVPKAYLLTGDHPKLKELEAILRDTLKSEVRVDPFWNYLQASDSVMSTIRESQEESFFDVIAPISVIDDAALDLIPEERKMQLSIEEQGRQVVKLGILALILVIFISALFIAKIYFKSTFLNNLEKAYMSQRQDVETLEGISTKTRIVKDFLKTRHTPLEVMVAIKNILPAEIYLESLLLNDDGTIEIRGTSESMSQVFSLVSALEDSDLFKGVKTKSTTAKKLAGKDVAAFEIGFKLEAAPDTEEKEAVAPEEQE